MLNTQLTKAAQQVMGNTTPNQFTITAKFTNSQAGSTFAWSPLRVDQLVINRDFLGNFADEIDLTATVSGKDYALLQDQGQNLQCVLTLTYVNQGGRVVFSPPPVQKQYHVILSNSQDIRKSVPDINLYTEPQINLKVRLVEPTVYSLRHTKINTIFQKSTVTQVIHGLTNMLGISKLQLTPSDNSQQYDHVDFSSYEGIDKIFSTLHDKCGVYQKGSNIYLTDGVLYVYPPFETAPTYDKTAIFYQVAEGDYTGSHAFHSVSGKTVSIVVNKPPEAHDLSVAGAENVGTGFVFTRASRLTDGMTTIDSKQGVQHTAEPALSVVLNTARTAVQDVNNLFHIRATDNPFPAMGHVMQHQASMMNVMWQNADPFQLDPGHAVTYYYDQNKIMMQKTGIVQHAKFTLKPLQKMDAKDMFSAVGELVLRVAPNTTQTF